MRYFLCVCCLLCACCSPNKLAPARGSLRASGSERVGTAVVSTSKLQVVAPVDFSAREKSSPSSSPSSSGYSSDSVSPGSWHRSGSPSSPPVTRSQVLPLELGLPLSSHSSSPSTGPQWSVSGLQPLQLSGPTSSQSTPGQKSDSRVPSPNLRSDSPPSNPYGSPEVWLTSAVVLMLSVVLIYLLTRRKEVFE